jgi:hypothetical protein
MPRPAVHATGPFFQTSLLAWHAGQKARHAAEAPAGTPPAEAPAVPQAYAGTPPGAAAVRRRHYRRRPAVR